MPGLRGLVLEEPVRTCVHEPLLPTPIDGLEEPRTAHDVILAAPLGGREHDDSPAHMLLGTVRVPDNRFQPMEIVRKPASPN